MMDSAEREFRIEDNMYQMTTESDSYLQNQKNVFLRKENVTSINSNPIDRITETLTPVSSLMDSTVQQENGYIQQAISTSVFSTACDSNWVQNVPFPQVLASPAEIDRCDSSVPWPVPQNDRFHLSLTSGLESTPQHMETTRCHGPDSSSKNKEVLDTDEVLQRVVSDLKKLDIPMSVFAERVLNCPRNTLYKFMRHPKPWPKLTPLRTTLLQKMWHWLQEPELKRLSAVFPNSYQVSDDKPCFLCNILCNEAYGTGYPVSVENCSRYGIVESLPSDSLICVACHSKQFKDDQNRIPSGQGESSMNEVHNCSEPVCTENCSESVSSKDKHGESVCSNVEHSDLVCSNDKHSEPVCSNEEHSKLVCSNDEQSEAVCSNDEHSEPVCIADEHSEPVCITDEQSEPVCITDEHSEPVCITDEHSEPVCSKTDCIELVSSTLEKSESNEKLCGPVRVVGKEMLSGCSSVLCNKYRVKHKRKRILSKLSSKFNDLEPGVKKLVMSKCGEQGSSKSTEMYACGWCKFRSASSLTVVNHHYIKHQTQELDVVRLKTSSRKYKSPSCVKFSCESCPYKGRLRHQLHLHNDRCHEHSQNPDGITDCESEGDCSIVYPYFKYDTKLPNNFLQTQKKYNLKDVKIPCQDIFKSGLEYLLKSINGQGVSKLCVDSLDEGDFVSMATVYREDVSYCDTRVESYAPVSLEKLAEGDIESLVRN